MMAFGSSLISSGAMVAVVDAALRGVAAAGAVGAGLWALRVRGVAAQKVAWTLVLVGAMAMPLLAPWAARMPWLPKWIPDAAAIADAAKAQMAAMRMARVHVEAAPVTNHPVVSNPATHDVAPVTDNAAPVRSYSDSPHVAAAPVAVTAENSFASDGIDREVGPQYPVPEMMPRAETARSTAADVALALYLGVAAMLMLRLFYGLASAMRLWEEGHPVELDNAHGRVRVHNDIASPVTVGSGILLPAEFTGWESEKLRIVLAHEGEHVRQGDFYLQLAAGIYAAVFWFSPLGWWLKRKLSDLGEAISDHAAVHEAESRASYAQILLEFASQPYTTQMGVAMAREGRMTQRMERLLNETRFQQAFAGGRKRVLAAVMMAPVAVFAATVTARVEAKAQAPANGVQQVAPTSTQAPATNAPQSEPASVQAPATGVSHPDSAPIETSPAPDAAPAAVPVPPTPPQAPEAPASDVSVSVSPNVSVSTSTQPNTSVNAYAGPNGNVGVSTSVSVGAGASSGAYSTSYSHPYGFSYSTVQDGDSSPVLVNGNGRVSQMIDDDGNGNSYAIITGHGHPFSSHAHSLPDGDYLWFKRGGKEYVVTDPQVLARIHAIYQPMRDLGEQMKIAGKQQKEAADRLKAELAQKRIFSGFDPQEFNKQMAEFRARQPEFDKQMAELKQELAEISVPKKIVVDQKQLDDLKQQMAQLRATEPGFNSKLSDLINKMVQLETPKIDPIDEKKMAEINAKMKDLTKNYFDDQGRITIESDAYKAYSEAYKQLGEQMSGIGAEQGKLGSEMGRMAGEADRKVRAIIDESLRNGTAKPVQ